MRQRQLDNEDELEKASKDARLASARKLDTLRRDLEVGLQEELGKHRSGWTDDMKTTMAAHEQDLRALRNEAHAQTKHDRDAHDAERREIRHQQAAELERLRELSKERHDEAAAVHDERCKATQRTHEDALAQHRAELNRETHSRQRDVISSVRAEQAARARLGLDNYQKKMRTELDMVKARLRAEAEASEQSLRQELTERQTEARRAMLDVYDGLKKDESDAAGALHEAAAKSGELEEEIAGVMAEVAEEERRIDEQAKEVRRLETEAKARDERRREAERAAVDQREATERKHAARLLELERRRDAARDALGKAVSTTQHVLSSLEDTHAAELRRVKAKVASVLERKETEAGRLADQLAAVQAANDAKQGELDSIRQKSFM